MDRRGEFWSMPVTLCVLPGRNNMLRDEMVTVFGGSGFVGRYVVRELARRGYRVRVATRRRTSRTS